MNADEKKRIKAKLEEERDRLLATISDAETVGDGGELSSIDQHPADLATETFERSKDASIRELDEARLRDVDDALHRLQAGTYGTCEACGRPIPKPRLQALPATRHCLEDQQAVERLASANRAEAQPAGPHG